LRPVTVALGTAAPFVSVTTPSICPFNAWDCALTFEIPNAVRAAKVMIPSKNRVKTSVLGIKKSPFYVSKSRKKF
jgi:hypothetical protein